MAVIHFQEGDACQRHLQITVSLFSLTSLWTQPSDVNVLWNRYKFQDYSCLVSKETMDRRGADCFNLSKRGRAIPMSESMSAEFTIDEVVRSKPGVIRIGLDFSPATGTFAAMMRESNRCIGYIKLRGSIP